MKYKHVNQKAAIMQHWIYYYILYYIYIIMHYYKTLFDITFHILLFLDLENSSDNPVSYRTDHSFRVANWAVQVYLVSTE